LRIVVALDSFKGALTADEACRAVEAGLRAAAPDLDIVRKPMADGGEGTAAALLASRPGGQWIPLRVQGPLPERTVEAGFAWFPDDGTAVVEMAAASGLPLLAEAERNPLKTTTHGTGELIRGAVERGARRILLTIGGSATVDGGTGAAAALGWRFQDAAGRDVAPCGGALDRITRILPPSGLRLPSMTVLCDVTNPLCGPHGAAAVFGPQKGATPDMVEQLDAGLANLAARIKADLGKDVRDLAGGGAAGGLGAGAAAFFDARLAPGIETVIAASGLRDALNGADWCITGEGSFDRQSLAGKVVSGIAGASQAAGVPTVVFAGRVQVDREACARHGIAGAWALQADGMSQAESMRRTAESLQKTAAQWLRTLNESGGGHHRPAPERETIE
jgi:glycerate 2-kinase